MDNYENNFTNSQQIKGLEKITTLVYALQVAAFFFGITFIIAVIINYVKKDDVQGTWLEAHFKWQIKTFWIAVIGLLLGFATLLIGVGFLILAIDSIWVIYRIIKGWLRLIEGKAVY